MRWRIGSGDKIQVFKSNWIPRPQTFKPSTAATLDMESMVTDLIDDNQQWKEYLIHQHFKLEDAEQILRIPLPSSPKPDKIIWHYDKNGQYSVKNGHQLAQRIKHPDNPSCSKGIHCQWNVIWCLELPEKIKIFKWRAAMNLLPTAENLWKRKVLQDPICPRCKIKAESVRHAVMDCKAANICGS